MSQTLQGLQVCRVLRGDVCLCGAAVSLQAWQHQEPPAHYCARVRVVHLSDVRGCTFISNAHAVVQWLAVAMVKLYK